MSRLKPLHALLALGVSVLAIGVFLMIEEHILGKAIIRLVGVLFFIPSTLSFFRYLANYKSPWHEFPNDIQNES